MDISVTDFKQRCLEVVRSVERTGRPVTITRRGRAVAHLEPERAKREATQSPWEQLQALGGTLRTRADESLLRDDDFEALR
jgi:prevent-host-death family protein